jgi:hypothetical protein
MDGSSLLNDISCLPVGNIGSESTHLRYFNIGQIVVNTATGFMNENLGPVTVNMAVDLSKKRTDFWDALPLKKMRSHRASYED